MNNNLQQKMQNFVVLNMATGCACDSQDPCDPGATNQQLELSCNYIFSANANVSSSPTPIFEHPAYAQPYYGETIVASNSSGIADLTMPTTISGRNVLPGTSLLINGLVLYIDPFAAVVQGGTFNFTFAGYAADGNLPPDSPLTANTTNFTMNVSLRVEDSTRTTIARIPFFDSNGMPTNLMLRSARPADLPNGIAAVTEQRVRVSNPTGTVTFNVYAMNQVWRNRAAYDGTRSLPLPPLL